MADLAKLKASVADLTAKVKADSTVQAGVVTLLQSVVQQNKDLSAKVAGMNAGAGGVSQTDLDALSQEIADQATALDQGTAALSAAVVANTQASGVGNPNYPGPTGDPNYYPNAPGNISGTQTPAVQAGIQPNPSNPVPLPVDLSVNPALGPAGSDAEGQPRKDQSGSKPQPLAGTGALNAAPPVAPQFDPKPDDGRFDRG